MEKTILKIENVSKGFKIPTESRSTIKSYFVNPFHKPELKEFKALDDVSFEVQEGDFLGIIGRNGSGKSTILKLIAQIYAPTKGKIKLGGRLVPFLELGVGFNPELTGRENVYLNGIILGMSRKFVEEKYEEIVDFAELRPFMDLPVKNYSSGMMVRLAFSIAVQAKADVYILDEILAVGDALFQQKSADVIRDLIRQKKTVLFVSHDLNTIKAFCNKVLWLEKGKVRYFGDTDTAINLYNEQLLTSEQTQLEQGEIAEIGTKEVVLVHATAVSNQPEQVSVELEIKHNKPVDHLNVELDIYDHASNFITGFGTEKENVYITNNTQKIKLTLRNVNLVNGKYYLNVTLFGEDARKPYHWRKRIAVFQLTQNKSLRNNDGVITLDHTWDLVE